MKTFIVLGMHRSGTSLIAKALENEIHMGDDFLAGNIFNPKGYFENKEFVQLNDRILGAAGGSWENPPSEKSILSVGFRYQNEIKSIINKHSNHDMWGWKDPRTTLTIKLYLPYLSNPHFIACFRDPREVVKSLANRGDLNELEATLLVEEYNSRLLNFLTDAYKLDPPKFKPNLRGSLLLGLNKIKRNLSL